MTPVAEVTGCWDKPACSRMGNGTMREDGELEQFVERDMQVSSFARRVVMLGLLGSGHAMQEKKMKLAGQWDWQQALGGCVVGPVSVCWALPKWACSCKKG